MRSLVLTALMALGAAQVWEIEQDRMATILFGVSFIDQDNGIVTGGQNGAGSAIFRTTDGGANYELLPTEGQPPPGLSIFLSAHLGSSRSAAAAGLCSWCFVATGIEFMTDGQTFRLANDPMQGFPPAAAAQGGDRAKNTAVPHYGFVGMWGVIQMEPQIIDYGIRHSTDAGVTWQRKPIAYRGSGLRYLSMPSNDVWYVSAGTWPNQDLFASPHVQHLSERLAVHFNNESKTQAYKVNFDAGNHGLKAGYRTAVLKSTNQGVSWEVVFERLDNDYYLNQIDCFDVNNCMAVGEGLRVVVLRTTDGGRSWSEVNLGFTDRGASAMDVKFLTPTEIFVSGGILRQDLFQGIIFHSTDGGNNWRRQTITNGEVFPVSLSLYRRRDGRAGGHGTGLTPEGLSSTIVYRYR